MAVRAKVKRGASWSFIVRKRGMWMRLVLDKRLDHREIQAPFILRFGTQVCISYPALQGTIWDPTIGFLE